MKTIFITRKLPEEAVSGLREMFEVDMWPSEDEVPPKEVLIEKAQTAHALWTNVADTVDRDVIKAGENLEVIANLAVGYNNIDIEAAKQRGIMVTNTPGVLTETTADLAFTLMLAAARQTGQAERFLREGKWTSWSPMGFTGMDIFGATLGIVGMGRIGEGVARRAAGFDMDVLYHNRTRKPEAESMFGFRYAELDDLLEQSDFVVILTPLTEETRGMIGERELGLMKKTAILVNAARGGIVDEEALYEALKNGDIWAAGLDVFEGEPIGSDHQLLTLPNVTALPHIGSASVKTRLAMMQLNAEDIEAVFSGRAPENRVV
ncbi:D-glycerate dehydrogenase [Bhargavaea cecembensis]|uniref:D-glycerate dehydrogenase n=1 Tax=Bhargavaea cecembensis TaxID=394098 RepID=A0A161SMC3_9BACL|nr:D-glycerate dehydrogenase [Bhargavaea cecembensis]KZE39003.1 D-glycerate dehydrogenase [Bhargavaea cecembensis]